MAFEYYFLSVFSNTQDGTELTLHSTSKYGISLFKITELKRKTNLTNY